MPIPDGKLYMDGSLGNGTIATLEHAEINAETAGGDIGFGCGVIMKNGQVIQATKGPIYGIALKRTYIEGDHLSDLPNDKWHTGEVISVVRDGTVAVPVSDDVNKGENATVDANGQFKPASASDPVVGVFVSSGNKGSTASLQTRVVLGHGNADDAGAASAPTSNSSSSNSSGSGSSK